MERPLGAWLANEHPKVQPPRRPAGDERVGLESSLPQHVQHFPVGFLVANNHAVIAAARYPDAPALLADLERFEQGLAVPAWSEPLWHRVRRFGSRNAVLLWLLAAYPVVKSLLFFLRNH